MPPLASSFARSSTWLRAGAALVALAGLGAGGALAGELYTHDELTLHGGPGDSFPVRASIDSGVKITVLWCNGAVNWCLVQHNKQQGWAPLAALKADGPAAPASGNSGSSNSNSAAAASIGGTASVTAATAPAASAAPTASLAGGSQPASSPGIGISVGAAGIAATVKLR